MKRATHVMERHTAEVGTPRKILHVIDTLEIGGAERSLLALCQRLDRGRFEPVVCSLYAGTALQQAFEAADVRVHSIGLTGKYQFLTAYRRLARIVKHERPALLHTTLFRANQVGRLVGRLQGLPVISSFVNTSYDPIRLAENPHLSPFKLNSLRRVDAFTARWATGFHAVSEEVRRSSCQHLNIDPDRVSVIYRGREPADYERPFASAGGTNEELNLGDAYPVLLNVGRLTDQKGQRYLIEAMPQVISEFPKARLLVVGEGWMRGRLEETIARLGLSQHVQLLGQRDELTSLLARADCFVFPSLHEGMPGALIEAMLSSLPVVAADLPVIREVIDDRATGILVPAQDPQALAQAICKIAGDRALAASLGTSARSCAKDRFDINRIVRQTEDLFDRTIAAHST